MSTRAPVCKVCSKPVSGEYMEIAPGQAFHSACFVCSMCSVELGTKPFVQRDTGMVCSECAERTRPPAQHRVVPVSDGPSDKKICDRCKSEILAVIFREFEGKAFHTDCFRCNLCNGLCGKNPVLTNGNYYCGGCSEKGFLDACFKCKQPLSGGYTVALNQKYHKNCLSCWGCGLDFQGGSFYDSKSLPHCKQCAENNLPGNNIR
mmetsp:Transcript_39689/g.62762  ORF Transcript_39689/g.62762 Transcript_39689/m.62762 type:complete len:205 (-) Transcript_39689:112-726(-)